MQHRLTVLLVAVAALVAAGCVAPLPPGHVPPTVASVDVPAVVVAGSSFTVQVSVFDDHAVGKIEANVVADHLDDSHTQVVRCVTPVFEPAAVVNVAIVCEVPSFVPNGEWTVTVSAYDGVPPNYAVSVNRASASFEVTGGSDDVDPPVLELFEVSQEATAADSFTVTVRVSDEHLYDPYPIPARLRIYGSESPDRDCPAVVDRVEGTIQEWVFECSADEGRASGNYNGLVLAGLTHPHSGQIEDMIGNRLRVLEQFELT